MLQDVHLEGVAGAPALYQPSKALVHTGHTSRYSGMHTCTHILIHMHCAHTHTCTHTRANIQMNSCICIHMHL